MASLCVRIVEPFTPFRFRSDMMRGWPPGAANCRVTIFC